MSSIGLRELKNQLSRYVERAKTGETVSITNRGQIVAELNPPRKISPAGEPTTTLDELRRKGLLYGGRANDPRLYPSMPSALRRSCSLKLLDEERGSR